MTENKRTQVFISYSHRDKRWLDDLLTFLTPYIREGELDVWSDQRLKPGDKWQDEIEKALARAKVAVLLVSQHFLASWFIATKELPRLLKAAEEEGLTILWIPVSASSYKRTDINDYQATSEPSRPLDSMPPHKRKKELVNICEAINSAALGTNEAPDKKGPPQEAAPVGDLSSTPSTSGTYRINQKVSPRGGPPQDMRIEQVQPQLSQADAKLLQEICRHAFLIKHWIEVSPQASTHLWDDVQLHRRALLELAHSYSGSIKSEEALVFFGAVLSSVTFIQRDDHDKLVRQVTMAYTSLVKAVELILGSKYVTPEILFSDVHPADEYYAAIQDTCSKGLISGYADGTFRPVNNMTLGQFLRVLSIHKGFASERKGGQHFTDVNSSDYFYSAVETAAERNIIQGNADGTLEPYRNVRMAELCKMMVIAEGWPLRNPPVPTFSDVSTAHPYYAYIETAYHYGLVTGYQDGTLHPDEKVSRAQVCQVIHMTAMSKYR